MRVPSGLHPSPLETVTPVTTGVSMPPGSSRYSAPSGSFSAVALAPTQTRPAGATEASLNRTPPRGGTLAIVRSVQPSPGSAGACSTSRFPPAARIAPSTVGNAADTSSSLTLIVSPDGMLVRNSSPLGMSTQSRQESSGTQYGPSPSTAVASPTGSAATSACTCIIGTAPPQGADTERLADVYPVQWAVDRFLPADFLPADVDRRPAMTEDVSREYREQGRPCGGRRPGRAGRRRGAEPARRRLRGHRASCGGVAPAAAGEDVQCADDGAHAPLGPGRRRARGGAAQGRMVTAGDVLRIADGKADRRLRRGVRADDRARRPVRRAGAAGAAAGGGGGTAGAPGQPAGDRAAARARGDRVAGGRRRRDGDGPVRRNRRHIPDPRGLRARLRRLRRRDTRLPRRGLFRHVRSTAELQRRLPRSGIRHPPGPGRAVLDGHRRHAGPGRPA